MCLYYSTKKLHCPAYDLGIFLVSADDDGGVHWVFRAEFQVVGAVVDALEGVLLSHTDHADLAVLDFALFDKDGIAVEDPGIYLQVSVLPVR